MALQTSGQISLNDIHVEAGGSSGSQASINDTDIRGLIGKSSGAQMAFNEWYGAANEVTVTSEATINGQSNRKQMLASDFVSSGGTLVIPSGFWVWSDSTSTAALTIDVSCTVKNSGKIIGKGGAGGASSNSGGSAGGPAIKINSGVTGVTIQNLSGAYIAGGGGGGASGYYQALGGGGGGAGGGQGGSSSCGGAGGSLNASGSNGGCGLTPSWLGVGGEAGGAGGFGTDYQGPYSNGGGGGGRILPGSDTIPTTGGEPEGNNLVGGGAGAGAGRAGYNAGSNQSGVYGGGGGGAGWGAQGGRSRAGQYGSLIYGGSGGAAINDSGVSYTLSNSGTVYGAT